MFLRPLPENNFQSSDHFVTGVAFLIGTIADQIQCYIASMRVLSPQPAVRYNDPQAARRVTGSTGTFCRGVLIGQPEGAFVQQFLQFIIAESSQVVIESKHSKPESSTNAFHCLSGHGWPASCLGRMRPRLNVNHPADAYCRHIVVWMALVCFCYMEK